jgi:hypothetical protein
MPADVRIIVAAFGRRSHEFVVNLQRHIKVTIDCAVTELYFERVQLFTVTHAGENARRDFAARDVGNDTIAIARRGSDAVESKRADHYYKSDGSHTLFNG